MTLSKGDKLMSMNWNNPEYEVVSDPFYLTDAEGKTSYVVAVVLKEVEEEKKVDILDELYGLCEDCQGRPDGFNCPARSKLDEVL